MEKKSKVMGGKLRGKYGRNSGMEKHLKKFNASGLGNEVLFKGKLSEVSKVGMEPFLSNMEIHFKTQVDFGVDLKPRDWE